MPASTPPDQQQAPLMLGVSGLRGWVGRSLTPTVAAEFAAAYASHLKQTSGTEAPRVVIGRDSRSSGPMIQHAAVAGLLAAGCRVIDAGVLSTPGIARLVPALKANGGLVITASHNPQPWNGIKPLGPDGAAPPAEESQKIVDRYRAGSADYVEVDRLHAVTHETTGHTAHADAVAAQLDTAAIRKAGLTAVVDSTCGAGGPEATALLDRLGVRLTPLHGEPTGWFPHSPEPTAENLTELAETVPRENARVGLAQDPDADRLAIVDELGRYIGEEYTLALCAMHLMGLTDPPHPGQPVRTVAANLSTSRLVDDLAARAGAAVIRTPVGEANVAAAMREHGAALGGEGNGGVIYTPVGWARDSLIAMGLVLEMLALTGQPLSQIVDTLPRYAMIKQKLPLGDTSPDELANRLRTTFPDQAIDNRDGVRLDWPDKWIHLRPSNTEPILRLIAEAPSEAQANALIHQLQQTLKLKQ